MLLVVVVVILFSAVPVVLVVMRFCGSAPLPLWSMWFWRYIRGRGVFVDDPASYPILLMLFP